MKLFLVALLFSITAYSNSGLANDSLCLDASGNDILDQPDVFQELISATTTCYEASKIAENCAYGSSLDVSTAGLAYDVCNKELTSLKPAKKDLALLTRLVNRCDERYRNEEGTLYMSSNQFCKLKAISWIVNISQKY